MTRTQHFVFARSLLGAYVFVHFAALVPYAAELFSNRGMLHDGSLSPLIRVFPNILSVYDTPLSASLLITIGAAAGLTLSLSFYPRGSALLAYYVWAAAFTRNPLILNPSLPYVGLMLLACAAVRADAREVELRRWSTLLWIAMAIGYSYSGLTKLTSPSWLDGSAIAVVLDSPLSRPGYLGELVRALPATVLTIATWSTLLLETLCAPLCLFSRARPVLWASLVFLHVALLTLVQFADLTLGMLLLHALTFDVRWLDKTARLSASPCQTRNSTHPGRSPVAHM